MSACVNACAPPPLLLLLLVLQPSLHLGSVPMRRFVRLARSPMRSRLQSTQLNGQRLASARLVRGRNCASRWGRRPAGKHLSDLEASSSAGSVVTIVRSVRCVCRFRSLSRLHSATINCRCAIVVRLSCTPLLYCLFHPIQHGVHSCAVDQTSPAGYNRLDGTQSDQCSDARFTDGRL